MTSFVHLLSLLSWILSTSSKAFANAFSTQSTRLPFRQISSKSLLLKPGLCSTKYSAIQTIQYSTILQNTVDTKQSNMLSNQSNQTEESDQQQYYIQSNTYRNSRKLYSPTSKQVSWSFQPLHIYQNVRSFDNLHEWIHPISPTHQTITPPTTVTKTNNHKLTIIPSKLPFKLPSQTSSKIQLDPKKHLHVIYIDPHIIVLNKPSGILSVPGPNRKPSLLDLVYDNFGGNESNNIDKMVVHRLDMDTSGIVVYARSEQALKSLNHDFRSRNVKKTYEALVCGHAHSSHKNHHCTNHDNGEETDEDYNSDHMMLYQFDKIEGEIDLPLQRDHLHPPFMRVATTRSETERCLVLQTFQNETLSQISSDNNSMKNISSKEDNLDRITRIHAGFQKMMGKEPKESLTQYTIVSREEYGGLPVTRMKLIPVTGRTHQLRVHCAAIGHPILSDSIYGYDGEGLPNAGFPESFLQDNGRATSDIQQSIKNVTDQTGLNLCLHARELCIFHPVTRAPLIFKSDPPF